MAGKIRCMCGRKTVHGIEEDHKLPIDRRTIHKIIPANELGGIVDQYPASAFSGINMAYNNIRDDGLRRRHLDWP